MSQETSTHGLPDARHPDSEEQLVQTGERIVEQALTRGADAAEVFLLTGTGESYSIEKGAVGFASVGGEAGIGIRVLADRRLGFAYLTEPARAPDAIESAVAVAQRSDVSDFSFSPPTKTPRVAGIFDDRITRLGVEDGLAAIDAIVHAATKVHAGITVSGGSFGYGVGAQALVNSEDNAVAERSTDVGLGCYVVLKDGAQVTTGWKGHESCVIDERIDDPALVGREAAQQARACLGARSFGDGGPTDVVFHPHAAAALLEFITVPACYGEKAARGESIYAEKLGKEVVDPRLTMTDDPTVAGGLGSGGADAEGVPSRAVPLLRDGRLESFLYDRGTAAEFADGSQASTASATRSGRLSDATTYKDPPAVSARQVVVGSTDEKALEALVADVDSGVLVHDLLGAHTANPTSGDFSVSSTVLFEIKDGSIDGAFKPVMLAGNVPSLLAERFIGTSTERDQTSGHFSPMGLDVPYVALGGVHVVGS